MVCFSAGTEETCAENPCTLPQPWHEIVEGPLRCETPLNCGCHRVRLAAGFGRGKGGVRTGGEGVCPVFRHARAGALPNFSAGVPARAEFLPPARILLISGMPGPTALSKALGSSYKTSSFCRACLRARVCVLAKCGQLW